MISLTGRSQLRILAAKGEACVLARLLQLLLHPFGCIIVDGMGVVKREKIDD